MSRLSPSPMQLPSARTFRQALEIYLRLAYDNPRPDLAQCLPPEQAAMEDWLMQDLIQRDPPDAPLEQVRSFSLKLGNRNYPYMKLRLSRPPHEAVFLFSVDAHDLMLHAPPGSADFEPLQQLKQYNAALACSIASAWEQAGVQTERTYLRAKIRQARAH